MSFQDGQTAALAAYGMDKEALHALDRLQERTSLDPEIINTLQTQADTLDLPEGHYYMPLKDQTGEHAGYAAFKTVGAWPKPKLVLATILGPQMHPKGSNISHLMNASHSQDPAYLAPDLTKLNAYEPPYTLDQLPPHLRNDALHRWRAENGIELIHKEPDLAELERIWANWQQMPEHLKAQSEAKSRELFGKSNAEHYEHLKPLYKKADFAPGLPSKEEHGDISKLPVGKLVDFIIQRHNAEKAGPHYDVRFGTPETGLISFATKKELPKPGERIGLFPQPLHRHEYGQFEGTISEGYGKGEVRKHTEGQLLITKINDGELHFTTAHQRYPERFVLKRTADDPKLPWLLINTTPTEQIPYLKKHYDVVRPEKAEGILGSLQPGSSVQAKIDGAASLTKLLKDKFEVASYRTAKKTDYPIVHTERLFGGRPRVDIPPEYRNLVLRGELYGERKGKAIPPQELGGILNASLANALAKKEERGIVLKNLLFDVQGRKEPYAERMALLRKLQPHLPEGFEVPEEAKTPEDALALYKRVASGKNPLSHEGVVIHPPEGKPTKIKFTEDRDVYITGTFPGEGRLADSVGGFTYALKPGGPTVGKVGTGFSDSLRRDMAQHPDEYIGRVAKVRAQEQLPSGALRAPALIALHEDYPTKKADFDTDAYNAELSPQQRAALHRRFNYFAQTLRRKGVETGTAHKRILIPKDKLTEQDILGLGFEPVTIAIPEAGQNQFSSYRHPENTFHIHSHPEGWTMHEDRHPASTMIAKHEPTVLGKAKALVQGMPHLVTEGIPGLGYYLKGQIGGTVSTAKNILQDIDPKIQKKFEHLRHSPTWEPEEKAAMDKLAQGQQAALAQYGVAPEGWVPEGEQQDEQPPLLTRHPKPQPQPETHTPWWPAALAATAAGIGMYKHMRTPTFAKNNPYLRGVQQRASQHGFHEIVDVTPRSPENAIWKPNPELGRVGNAADWVNHHMKPEVDTAGNLDLWNRAKLWLRYGGDAIPVASRRVGGKDQLWSPGHEGPVNIKGVAFNRHSTPEQSETTPFRSLVHGGTDLEGPPSTLKAHTTLDLGGKHKEYLHWNKHDPGFMPETKGDLTSYLPPNHERLMQSPEGRLKLIHEMRQNMRKGFGRKGEDFIMKPDLGAQSGGELPWASENWTKHLRDYERHMAKPKNRAAYQAAAKESDIAGVHYLRENDIFEGHVLNQMLKNPRSAVVAQREIPNYQREHEYRVHVINGEVPKSLITPRHVFETGGNIGKNFLGLPTGDVDYAHLQQIAQEHVNKLPANERKGIFGLDLHFDPETGKAHLIESNPVTAAGRYSGKYNPGGMSGFLDSNELPWASHVLHRHATGRHTTPVALGAAGLAAGGAGLTARLLTPSVEDDDQAPHPAG